MPNQMNQYVSVVPSVLKTGELEKEIMIRPLQPQIRKNFEHAFKVRVWFVDSNVVHNTSWGTNVEGSPFRMTENGDLVVTLKTPREGEYAVAVDFQKPDRDPQKMVLFIYALKEDLFVLRPFKGDFHMHSFCSDGAQSPEYVAATCRKTGFDFMALTDHKRYAPSLQARDFIAEMGCDMLVTPGEEIHLPDNPVHIVNFGGTSSVNDLAYEDEEKYRAGVAEYMKEVPEDYEAPARFQVAASEWIFDRVRETGGICMFCHPFWRPMNHNYIGEDVIDLLMEHNKFDVLEVFGGFYVQDVEDNMLSLSRWQEERAKGKVIPVAGVSDSHDCDHDLAGWYYTVLFAEKLDFDSIAESIRSNRSTAVHWIPGRDPVVAGSFRLTKFVYFLLREFYPQHDALCALEGEMLRRHLSGEEPDAKVYLASRKGRVAAFMNQYWEKA